MFSLSLGILFASLKISYSSQSSSYKRTRVLNIKKGKGAYGLWEDQGLTQEKKPASTGFRLSLDLIMQILKNWQKYLPVILGKLKVLLGLPF